MSPIADPSRAQREVDALLGGAEPPAPAVRLWEAGRRSGWSRAQRAVLEGVAARYAAALEVHLAAVAQSGARVQSAGVECLSSAELMAALEVPAAAFAVHAPGVTEMTGLIDFGAGFALEWVERVLGGPGGPGGSARALTNFEQALVRALAERALALLAGSWEAAAPARLECGTFHADAALARLTAGEPMLVSHYEISLGADRHDHLVALPAAPFVSSGGPGEGGSDHAPVAASLASQLQRTHVEVGVRFPEVRLTARSLTALSAGQILHTRFPTDGAFDVRINGRSKFRGHVGQVRSHLGVRITDIVREAGDPAAARSLEGRIL